MMFGEPVLITIDGSLGLFRVLMVTLGNWENPVVSENRNNIAGSNFFISMEFESKITQESAVINNLLK